MQEYSIPKKRFSAEVVFAGGQTAKITLFHGQGASSHTGRERPSDVLNGKAAFLPAIDADGRILLLNVEAVRIVSVSVNEEWGNPEAEGADADYTRDLTATIHKIVVTLDDGSRLSGIVRYELPESGRRLQDFLNLGDRFLPLIDQETIRFINRRCVNGIGAMDEMKVQQ